MHIDELLLAAVSLEQVKAAKAVIVSCFEVQQLREVGLYQGIKMSCDHSTGSINLLHQWNM